VTVRAAAIALGVARDDAKPPPPATPWLTAAEAAAYLRLPSTRALYKRCERGQVRAHRWGRQLRFHRRDLDRLLQSEPVSAAAEENLG
jgi:excisionase family DNA binding protein